MLSQTSIVFWSLPVPYWSKAQKLSDRLHWWNESRPALNNVWRAHSVFTGVSVLSFGLELRVDIVNHCWIERNLRLLLLLILYAEEFIVTEVMLWSQKKNSIILTFKSKWWTYSKFERYKLSSRGASLGIYNKKYKRIGYQWKPSPTSPMVQIWVLISWEWSPTIAEIWNASWKRFVSDYPRRSGISTISSFR